jgi:hypothetical protein
MLTMKEPSIDEGGAWGRTFSCQLSNTLIAWPPPSPPPREWTCEKPVAWGVMLRVLLAGAACAMPL